MQRAAVDGGQASIGVGSAENLRASAGLGQGGSACRAAMVLNHAAEGAAAVVHAHGQCLAAARIALDRSGSRQGVDRGSVAIPHVEDRAAGDVERGLVVRPRLPGPAAVLQRTAFDINRAA